MQIGAESLIAFLRLARAVLRSASRPLPLGASGAVSSQRRPVQLGRTAIHLVTLGPQGGRLVWVNVHENERTSVQAATALMQEAGWPDRLLLLRAQGQRHVVFWLGWRPHAFDPNRIFTDDGIVATLRRHASDSPRARQALIALRDAILAEIGSATPSAVVALHNNGRGHYDIASYLPGAALAREAADVHVAAGADPGDFVLVTQPAAYKQLAHGDFGVVLMGRCAPDDGSMAHAFLNRPTPAYFNVEARYGHGVQQLAMLRRVRALALQRHDAAAPSGRVADTFKLLP